MNKQGYTLIEVTLFLALSSVLSLVAFVGLGPRLRNVRFTSGMRGISDVISKQSANLDVGFNSGSDAYECKVVGTGASAKPVISPVAIGSKSTGSSEGCVINGRVFFFDNSRLTTYYITSLRKIRDGCSHSSDLERLLCYAPRAYNSVFNTQQPPAPVVSPYPNGITFNKSVGGSSKTNSSQAFGYLIDPETSSRYQFVYGVRSAGSGGQPRNPGDFGGANEFKTSDMALSESKSYCFNLSGRFASLKTSPNSLTPVLTFEDEACR